jgi:hypothetical protein
MVPGLRGVLAIERQIVRPFGLARLDVCLLESALGNAPTDARGDRSISPTGTGCIEGEERTVSVQVAEMRAARRRAK